MTSTGRYAKYARPIASAAALALVVAALGSTMTDLGPWYSGLRFPAWKPPDWLFGPAWTTIFACVALSAGRAWVHSPSLPYRARLLALFVVNGLLNVAWSALFFGLHRPDWAMTEVVVLWASIVVLIVYAWRASPVAALLLVPYLAWVSFAAALNWAVVKLNAPFGA
jgi:tryptophan-rich sensory protein